MTKRKPLNRSRPRYARYLLLVMAVFLWVSCNSDTHEAIEPTSNRADGDLTPTHNAGINNDLSPTATIESTVPPTGTPTAVPTPTPANEVVIDPAIELTQTHQTEDGRLLVHYPEGWDASGLRRPGETVNNAALSNNSSGFTGNSGQILVQIFEPVYVMELFGIADTSQVTLEDVYTAIISGNEQNSLENGRKPKYLSLNGRELLRFDFTLPQYDTMMLSLRTSDGYIVQMNAVAAPGELDQFVDTVMAIAATLDYTVPDRDIPEGSPADVVRNHFQIVESGKLQDVQDLYCERDLIFGDIFNSLVEEATDFENIEESFETLAGADRALTAPDFSHLFYQTVLLEEEDRAIVRISGNVILTNKDGDRELVPYLNFTPMDTDGWSLIWENKLWKICVQS